MQHDAEVVPCAGLCQLSSLESLLDLSLMDSFDSCTDNGLIATTATMTGTAPSVFSTWERMCPIGSLARKYACCSCCQVRAVVPPPVQALLR
jgi:hypothetical protein